MKKIKILILLLLVVFLTGCSGTYNLTINKDFSVDENLNLLIDNDGDKYSKTLNLFKENNISKNKYKVRVSDKNVEINYNEKYSSLEDYVLNSKVYHQMFDDIKYSYSDGLLDFNTNFKGLLTDSNSETIYNNYNFSMLQINVNSPFIVKSSNADIQNDNLLSWTFDKNTRDKSITFELAPEESRSNVKEIVLLGMLLFITVGAIAVIIIRFKDSHKI